MNGANRGFHVHAFGDPRNNGLQAGGHFDPFLVGRHSIPENTPRHAGDMGNIFFHNLSLGEGVRSAYHYLHNAQFLSLSGKNNVVGRAVIVHQNPDNCDPNNNGNAGARIFVGVCGIANQNRVNTTIGILAVAQIPTTQNTEACNNFIPPPSPSIGGSVQTTAGFVTLLACVGLLL